jgi:hypothetical protein
MELGTSLERTATSYLREARNQIADENGLEQGTGLERTRNKHLNGKEWNWVPDWRGEHPAT